MNTAVVNFKIDPSTKREAQAVAHKMGVSLSALIKSYLKEIAKTKTATFSAREEPSPYFIKMLKKAEADIRAGRVSPAFDNAKDAIAWLDKEDGD